jgi:LysW-gamma-L-lysine carboxypeptidase
MNSKARTDAIELLTKLVSIPSPSTQEAKASIYLTGWMNAHGLAAHVDEVGNAVGVKGDGPNEILLLGHIDTFPGEVPVRVEGDILFGRGTVDAKGPLCTFAAAAAQVEVPQAWRISVVGAVEEEAATSKGAHYVLRQRLKDTSPAAAATSESHRQASTGRPPKAPPAYCLIGEPSSWDRVTLGYKGRLLMDVKMRVPFSHSAGAGRLPAEQAVDFWKQVEHYCEAFNKLRTAATPFSRLDPSLRHIATSDEGIAGTVEMSLGFRLPLGLDPAELERDLQQRLDTLPAGTSAEVRFSGQELAYKSSKSSPLVRVFLRAIRAEQGQPRFVVKTGTADMNVVAPHWPQTPIVAYGPGNSKLDHTPDEQIDLNEYVRAIKVLQRVLKLLMA